MKPSIPSVSEIERILVTEIAGMLSDTATKVTAETPLQTLGLDSLRLFELFVLVEKQFGISLLDGPLSRQTLENPAALARHIAGRLQSDASP